MINLQLFNKIFLVGAMLLVPLDYTVACPPTDPPETTDPIFELVGDPTITPGLDIEIVAESYDLDDQPILVFAYITPSDFNLLQGRWKDFWDAILDAVLFRTPRPSNPITVSGTVTPVYDYLSGQTFNIYNLNIAISF